CFLVLLARQRAPPPRFAALLIAPFAGPVKWPRRRGRARRRPGSGDGRAAPGGEVLPHEPRRAAQRLVGVAERRLVYPLAVHPGVEGRLGSDTDLDQAL